MGNDNGHTPLRIAFENHNVLMWETLLDGARYEIVDIIGFDLLVGACLAGSVTVVTMLFERRKLSALLKHNNSVLDYKGTLLFPIIEKLKEGNAKMVSYIEIIRLILESTDPKYRTKKNHDGQTPLTICCQEGYIEIVELLLNKMAPKYREQRDDYGRFPLYEACIKKNTEIVKLLLDGARRKYRYMRYGEFAQTPLMGAIAANSIDTVKLLLEEENDSKYCEMVAKDGFTAVELAIFLEAFDIAKFLLEKFYSENSDVEFREGAFRELNEVNGPLEDVIRLMLTSGNPRLVYGEVCSVLHLICKHGYFEAVEAILERFKPTFRFHKNVKFYSPLYLAVKNHHIDIVKLLYEYNAEAFLAECKRRRDQNNLPLLWVAAGGGDLDIAKFLSSVGDSGKKVKDKRPFFEHIKNTPMPVDVENELLNSCKEGNVEAVQTILSNAGSTLDLDVMLYEYTLPIALLYTIEGAYGEGNDSDSDCSTIIKLLLNDTNPEFCEVCFNDGVTPLMLACKYGLLETVKVLLEFSRPEYKHIRNEKDGTPLWLASENGHFAVVALLLKDTNNEEFKMQGKKTFNGNDVTPLSAAVRNNHLEVAIILLEGTSPQYREVPDSANVTPLMRACVNNNVEMVNILLNGSRPEYKEIGCAKYGTPLDYAAENDLIEIHELLMD
eukprot:TRINITY_DN4678_c1_g1_i3.p1 TRINITY_DN4678_c1_g1~~TRINITY_DN4678_c1_g1_i3.p1  ORF type:complete len:777 (-),score=151.36 TRINITY_DN4678_c1_g1_i3:236-2236(-)